ncbi:MAG: ABC transporter ATP-binding protein/permease [Alicyclobacillus sp.]|nr:ABC transporter ATP-binding protein/permease [Alicyclobacillus sp.]
MSSIKTAFNNEAKFHLRDIHALNNAARILWLLACENWLMTITLAVVTLIQGLIPVWEVSVLGRFVNQISAIVSNDSEPLLKPLYWSAGTLLVLMMARNGVQLAAAGLQDYLRDRMKGRLQMRVLQKAFRMEISFFDHEDSYEELQRANAMLSYRTVNVLVFSLNICQSMVTSAGYIVVISRVSWWLGFLIVVAAFPSLWWKIRNSKQGYIHDYSTLTPTRRRLSYFEKTMTDNEFAKEVRLFGLANHLLQTWQKYQKIWLRETLQETLREAKASLVSDVVLQAVFTLAAIVFAVMIAGGHLSLGIYVMLLQMIRQLQGAIESMMRMLRNVYQDGLFAENLFRFLERPVQSVANGMLPFPQPFREGITFEDVWFRYPGAAEWALRGVSFHIPAGQTVSLVGRNGSGKTTLVKLMMGMYKPDRGRILIDGIPIQALREDDLWRHMTVIFQDFTRFELTLRESIGFGDISKLDNMNDIRRAAMSAGVAGMADELKDGYDTLLSQAFGGVNLSGGQWQKVALARTLMRDADILILDEPTSALDPRAEYMVFEQFKELAGQRTTILISHRVGTARLADEILVMSGGQLTEMGHHDHLVASEGEYASLFEAQAQWYRESATGEEVS